MSRYIDADALKYDIGEIDDGQYKRTELYVTNEAIAKQPTIDAVPLDGSFLKMSKGGYVIYQRKWLYEHLEQEFDILRSASGKPTVDAIPIEWIEKQRKWMTKGSDREQNLKWLLDEWRKEHAETD